GATGEVLRASPAEERLVVPGYTSPPVVISHVDRPRIGIGALHEESAGETPIDSHLQGMVVAVEPHVPEQCAAGAVFTLEIELVVELATRSFCARRGPVQLV